MNKVTLHTDLKLEGYKGVVPPEQEAWDFFMSTREGDVHIFEDTYLPQHVNYDGKIKIAMIIEVPEIYDFCKGNNRGMFHPHQWLKENHHHFDYVFSAFRMWNDIVGPKYHWTLAGDCRIPKDQQGLYEKERLLSAIASFKRWTRGHQMRHAAIERFRSHMDVYGSGYNNIINQQGEFGKVIALAPYAFTIVVANAQSDDYFSEQLTDALLVGTVPIYWGTKNVKNHFNMGGIIQFETLEELGAIIPTLSMEKYQSMLPAIEDNAERAKNYGNPIDWLYKNKGEFLRTVTKI